jgi:alpha-mannosidase
MLESERSLYESRVRQFIGRLKNLLYEEKIPLSMEYRVSEQPVSFEKRLEGSYKPIRIGDLWGRTWASAWFHLKADIPGEWRGRHAVAALNFTGEACVFSAGGVPLQGLTGNSVFMSGFIRKRFDLFASCKGGETVDLWIEAAANGLFGVETVDDPERNDPDRHGRFDAYVKEASIAVFRDDIWHLMLDFRVLSELMLSLPDKSVRRSRIIRALNSAIDIFHTGEAGVKDCRMRLADEMERPAYASDLQTLVVGHAHIDTGWLWPVRETIRKCARTFSTQIRIMEKYPDFVFGASQAQHYLFVKEYYPDLYKEIKEKVAGGQWEIQGAMWVEADNNLISGESLVRQVLHGKNFFLDEFSVDVKNLWLPDVFGYSAALPQILKKSGIDFFVTQKISWSQFNKFPHHTFIWRGIDGSEVIAHFPPEDTYNSELRPGGLVYAQENFAEKGFLDEFLTLFGAGDGGGGPKEEYIEMGLRQRDLEGSPRVCFGPAQSMLDRLGKERDKLETWVGELYLELHRGTLTTQAKNKKMNRRLESRLRQTEFMFSCLPLKEYPGEELDSLWKKLLINQFHDIIPGSSIHMVYEDSLRDYAEMESSLDSLIRRAAGSLFAPREDSITLVNTLSYPFSKPVMLPLSWAGCNAVDEEGNDIFMQEEPEGCFAHVPVASQSIRSLYRQSGRQDGKAVRVLEGNELFLENDFFRYEFNDGGALIRAWDKKAEREAVSRPGNQLNLYEDRPAKFDAWDIDLFYENQLIEQAKLISWKSFKGSVRQYLVLHFDIGQSKIEQKVILDYNSKRLDFCTRVEWRERHKMLRVGFFANVFSHVAQFDTQFGILERSTHRNTPWDRARFEVCGHRFADLSEAGYGVALLNDCKYGYKVHDGELNLNLLRSPTNPDPDADIGNHSFTYSLLPHQGNLAASDVWAEAAQLNQPLELLDGMERGDRSFPLLLEGEGIVLEVLKKAEKEECLIIRAYETRGCPGCALLKLVDPALSLFETDLMERGDTKVSTEEVRRTEGRIALSFTPFEIKTFKLKREP